PRASAGSGDLHPAPAQPSSSPNPAAPIINALLEDLFNPSISTLDLCNLHGLSLAKLADILESETFKAAREAFERINAARSSIIESEAKALATARLADQLKDNPESPSHAETQRKAASALLPRTSGGGADTIGGGGLASSSSSSSAAVPESRQVPRFSTLG
ncbi:MAG: hypothetical protein ACWA5W_02360, partial [Phycisphaerales bacterium]